ncbi:hypothetical protein MCETHM1_03152 [Flavobacteriaceae bacterium]
MFLKVIIFIKRQFFMEQNCLILIPLTFSLFANETDSSSILLLYK